MVKTKIQKPPQGLKRAGKRFWVRVMNEFVLEETHDLARLEMACRCLDEIVKAEGVVEQDGMYIKDRFLQTREHPAMKTCRDNRTLFLRAVRELGLDLEQSPESRPPGRY